MGPFDGGSHDIYTIRNSGIYITIWICEGAEMSRHSGLLSQFPGDFGHIHYYLNMRRSRNEQAFWFVVAVSWWFRPAGSKAYANGGDFPYLGSSIKIHPTNSITKFKLSRFDPIVTHNFPYSENSIKIPPTRPL